MPVSTLYEDELHPRLQVREYARYLQGTYGELLEPTLPESLTSLLGRIELQNDAQDNEVEESALRPRREG